MRHKKDPIKWADQMPPPERKVTRPDGTVGKEKLCPIPLKTKMVDADGNVVEVALANGYVKRRAPGDSYGSAKLEEKKRAGFLPYAECPLYHGIAPLKGEKPCEGDEARNRKTACKHLERVIYSRRADKKKKAEKYAERFKTNNDRILEYLKTQAEENHTVKDDKVGESGTLGR